MTYRIQFNGDSQNCAGVSPTERVVYSPYTSTAIEIMERAREVYGMDYQFTAKYYGVSMGGYFIESVSGVYNKADYSCSWAFYIQAPGGQEFKPSIGVSTYVPGDNFIFTLRYESFRQAPTISSKMAIQYNDATCFPSTPPTPPPTATVSIPQAGATALDVMQAADDNCGFDCNCKCVSKYDYSFVATYQISGFIVDALNNVINSNRCKWVLFIENPNGIVTQGAPSPSNQQIPAEGYTVIWRYMQQSVGTNTTSRVSEEL